jgi:hypothetical protein
LAGVASATFAGSRPTDVAATASVPLEEVCAGSGSGSGGRPATCCSHSCLCPFAWTRRVAGRSPAPRCALASLSADIRKLSASAEWRVALRKWAKNVQPPAGCRAAMSCNDRRGPKWGPAAHVAGSQRDCPYLAATPMVRDDSARCNCITVNVTT